MTSTQAENSDNRHVGFVPVDADARTTISDDLGATLFVEASAGTGKTTSLVQRVTNLVATGTTTLNRIAAITFTEAAAELRDRIRSNLEEASVDEARSGVERTRCRQGVADLDQADICTLHSFAGSLLRERPLEAGLPPSFETSDEIVAGIKFEEEWSGWLDRQLDGDTDLAPHLALALTLGLTLTHLRTVGRSFHLNHSDLSDVAYHSPDFRPPAALVSFLDAVAELERLRAFSKIGQGDPLYDHVMDKLAFLRRLPGATTDPADGYRLLLGLLPLRQSRGRQGDWNIDPDSGRNACAVLKDILRDLDQEAKEEIQNARRAVLMPILEDVRQLVVEYAGKRRSEGRAEFHDLLVWARELLRDDAQVRDYFHDRYTHLLIDEAQDTDPIQTEIAMLLAGPVRPRSSDPNRPVRWDQISPEPGKLFVVGDPKQSIYRFRRADVGQMKRLQSSMEQSGGRTLKLVQNFRSHKPVIGWVNRLFEQCMEEGHNAGVDDGNTQAVYDAMAALWIGDTGNPFGPSALYNQAA